MIIRTPPKLTNRRGLVEYVEISLWSWLRDLMVGLFKITFKENFQSFTVQLTILAGTEVGIANQFSLSLPGTIPSGRLITRQKGNAVILDGDTPWTTDTVYLKNPSANDATITVIFFR
ncbi:Uncharacterised protein [uncultured archaeon]|nr:Uncharacterised protein [uncultured archaeon]